MLKKSIKLEQLLDKIYIKSRRNEKSENRDIRLVDPRILFRSGLPAH